MQIGIIRRRRFAIAWRHASLTGFEVRDLTMILYQSDLTSQTHSVKPSMGGYRLLHLQNINLIGCT